MRTLSKSLDVGCMDVVTLDVYVKLKMHRRYCVDVRATPHVERTADDRSRVP
jgi:hypothetical protein